MRENNLLPYSRLPLLLENVRVISRMPFTALNIKTFQALFDYASIGILITNSKGEIQMANKYIEHQFGYMERELVGAKVETLIPPRYKERHEKHRERYSGDPHSRPMGLGMELSGLKKDGSEFPVEVSLGHYTVEKEPYALAFISDITQRKETEQAIKQLNAHLEEKVKEGSQSLALTVGQLSTQIKETERKDAELQRVNTFLNNIWNHAGAIIIVCDREGLIQFFNPAAEAALGYNANEIVNKHDAALFIAPDELVAKALELGHLLKKRIKPDFEVLAALAEMDQGNGMEWHYVRKDGSTFFVSLDITPLKDLNNGITGFLGIAIDISKKKVAEAELITALEKEKELNELKSRFVSMASHEFRTPLSAVLSSAYLLSRYAKTEEQPQRDKHIQRIVSSVSSLTEILNDFLSVSKIEEGNINPHPKNYDIRKQLTDIIPELQHLLKKGQSIFYSHAGENSIYSDPSMMRHIVINLLSNAIKFSPEGSVVNLTSENTENELVISVKDSGIGIPKEDQENLFKRFFRSSNVTNIQGTGLGLHIVAKYAELLNGKITCHSELEKGTQFTITFNNKTTFNENNSGY
jgi:PAS domain S-box-containing protein